MRAHRVALCLVASSFATIASCSSHDDITPKQLVKLMYLDNNKELSFQRSDTKVGEYGRADILDQDSIDVSLSYMKGSAYKSDTPPHSANEISTGVNGSYSYCVTGLNRNLSGNQELAQLAIPSINHLIVSLLHPDVSTLDSYKEHLDESSSLLQSIIQDKNGAVSGKGYDGSDETYYINGGWLWRWSSNDNFVMLCAYPVID